MASMTSWTAPVLAYAALLPLLSPPPRSGGGRAVSPGGGFTSVLCARFHVWVPLPSPGPESPTSPRGRGDHEKHGVLVKNWRCPARHCPLIGAPSPVGLYDSFPRPSLASWTRDSTALEGHRTNHGTVPGVVWRSIHPITELKVESAVSVERAQRRGTEALEKAS